MTYRANDLSSKDCYSPPETRLNMHRCDETGEGCPVIEESGTICGEKNTLNVFQEFREVYDDIFKKLDEIRDGNGTLKRLAPFKSLIKDLWEQNKMLVETVEELEKEATSRVTNLQDKLNKSCQKLCECQEDIKSLIKIIQRLMECGELDLSGVKFKTISLSAICNDFQASCCERDSIKQKNDFNEDSYCEEDLAIDIYHPSKVAFGEETFDDNTCLCSQNIPGDMCYGSQRICCTDNCPPVDEFEDTTCSDNNCQDCVRQININLNIGNDGNVDSECCCCACSRVTVHPEIGRC